MQHTKKTIKQRIAQGKLQEAIQAATQYADYCNLPDFEDELTVLSSRLGQNVQEWTSGLLSQEEYTRTQSKLTYGLIDLLSGLPDQAGVSKKAPRKPWKQSTFKWRLLIALIMAKMLVLFRLLYHWGTGGFNNEQNLLGLSLLLPTLIIYAFVIYSSANQQTTSGSKLPRYLPRSVLIQAYWLLPVYTILLILMIEYKVNGTFQFSHMGLGIALVESILGLFIARLIALFYKW